MFNSQVFFNCDINQRLIFEVFLKINTSFFVLIIFLKKVNAAHRKPAKVMLLTMRSMISEMNANTVSNIAYLYGYAKWFSQPVLLGFVSLNIW